jgi:hypothetical protein
LDNELNFITSPLNPIASKSLSNLCWKNSIFFRKIYNL